MVMALTSSATSASGRRVSMANPTWRTRREHSTSLEPFPSIAASEARPRLREFDVILDVREPDEWTDNGIGTNPKRVTLGRVMRDLNTEELQSLKGKKILVYCRSGGRSAVACGVLAKNGFDATNLAGGMRGWLATQSDTKK
jgi:rhodanese-related sulfurtransferase